MKSAMKWIMTLTAAAGLAWAGAGCKSSSGGSTEVAAKPYPKTTCLVADEALDSSAVSVVHNGQEVKFCCQDCVKAFEKEPDKYLSKLAAQ